MPTCDWKKENGNRDITWSKESGKWDKVETEKETETDRKEKKKYFRNRDKIGKQIENKKRQKGETERKRSN